MATFLGPLTTTFTPPASCLDVSFFYRDYNSAAVKLLDAPECFPSSYVSSGFYSPGLFCPSGYHGYTENDGAETSINCCPSQFQFSGPWPGACLTVDTAETISVYVTGNPTQATSTQYYPPTASLYASAIQVRYRSSDLASSTASSSGSISTTAGPSATAATSTLVSSSTPSSASNSDNTASGNTNGISTGAKIAIGVVVPVIVLSLIAVVAGLLYRRRSRVKAARNVQEMPAQEMQARETVRYAKNLVEVDGTATPTLREPVELDTRR
ncbi:uncharacterized protein PV09_07409 [Verruconis gallopava]|uniref:WSC domain-containing protein n=1 Tax=Verruconis gallopava TaxID=253628 RepID=A0A0D1YJT3_9PEZI|nr:uncharacterized protein PV09_07409 [Verruconis gallopava]KIW01122.1 hypothetical protein PV09_07409 [Verruconis gallopava]